MRRRTEKVKSSSSLLKNAASFVDRGGMMVRVKYKDRLAGIASITFLTLNITHTCEVQLPFVHKKQFPDSHMSHFPIQYSVTPIDIKLDFFPSLLYVHGLAADGDVCDVELAGVHRRALVCVEEQVVGTARDVGTTGRVELRVRRRSLEEPRALGVGSHDVGRGRVRDVVERARIAVAGEEEHVDALRRAHERGSLDERTVVGIAVQDLGVPRAGVEGLAVCAHALDHDGGRLDRLDSVVAVSTVTNVVAVDLPEEVQAPVDVGEDVRVDGASRAN